MKIATWNVNRFNGICNVGDDLERLARDMVGREVYAKKIIEKIGSVLQSEDDIVILQEVPYYNLMKKENEWKKKWKNLFDGFKVMYWFGEETKQDFNFHSINVTIGITKEESNWKIIP